MRAGIPVLLFGPPHNKQKQNTVKYTNRLEMCNTDVKILDFLKAEIKCKKVVTIAVFDIKMVNCVKKQGKPAFCFWLKSENI